MSSFIILFLALTATAIRGAIYYSGTLAEEAPDRCTRAGLLRDIQQADLGHCRGLDRTCIEVTPGHSQRMVQWLTAHMPIGANVSIRVSMPARDAMRQYCADSSFPVYQLHVRRACCGYPWEGPTYGTGV